MSNLQAERARSGARTPVTGLQAGELLKENCNILVSPVSIGAPELDLENLTYKGKKLVVEDVLTNTIQFKQNSTVWNSTSTTTLTSAPLPNLAAAGDLVICSVLYVAPNAVAETLSVTDNQGNSYKRAGSPLGANRANGNGGVTAEVWYAENISGGSGLRATFNFSQAMQANQSVRCYEYSGIAAANSLDQIQTSFGTSASPDFILGPTETNWNNELVFLAYWGPQVPPTPSGFSLIENAADGAMSMFTTSAQNLLVPFQNQPQMTAILLTFRSSK